jgi:uncharacterized UBP type Zn finger protein
VTNVQNCPHLTEAEDVAPYQTEGCEECLQMGSPWVHLRRCTSCGHIGCCDSSPNRHATAHYRQTAHPVVQSYEPGEDWRWCYVDEMIAG